MKTYISKYMFHNLRNYIQYKILHHIHFVYDTNQLNKMSDISIQFDCNFQMNVHKHVKPEHAF